MKKYCTARDYVFIDNGFIEKRDLKDRDKVHLSDFGKRKLVNNYIQVINQWWDVIVTQKDQENNEEVTSINVTSSEADNVDNDDISKFFRYRCEHSENPIFAYYNINSLRYKIIDLKEVMERCLPDILVVAESKLNETFTNPQFFMNDYYEPTRCDRTDKGEES